MKKILTLALFATVYAQASFALVGPVEYFCNFNSFSIHPKDDNRNIPVQIAMIGRNSQAVAAIGEFKRLASSYSPGDLVLGKMNYNSIDHAYNTESSFSGESDSIHVDLDFKHDSDKPSKITILGMGLAGHGEIQFQGTGKCEVMPTQRAR